MPFQTKRMSSKPSMTLAIKQKKKDAPSRLPLEKSRKKGRTTMASKAIASRVSLESESSASEENQTDDQESQESKKVMPSKRQQAAVAVRQVLSKSKLVQKLRQRAAALVEQGRLIKAELRRAERDLEESETIAKQKSSAAARQESMKIREKKKLTNVKVNDAKRRFCGMRGSLAAARSKVEQARLCYNRDKAAYTEALSECNQLEEDGYDEFCHHGRQAKARKDLRGKAFKIAETNLKKATAVLLGREQRQAAVSQKISQMKAETHTIERPAAPNAMCSPGHMLRAYLKAKSKS